MGRRSGRPHERFGRHLRSVTEVHDSVAQSRLLPPLQFRNFAEDLDGAFGVQEFVEQFLIVVQSFYRMR